MLLSRKRHWYKFERYKNLLDGAVRLCNHVSSGIQKLQKDAQNTCTIRCRIWWPSFEEYVYSMGGDMLPWPAFPGSATVDPETDRLTLRVTFTNEEILRGLPGEWREGEGIARDTPSLAISIATHHLRKRLAQQETAAVDTGSERRHVTQDACFRLTVTFCL